MPRATLISSRIGWVFVIAQAASCATADPLPAEPGEGTAATQGVVPTNDVPPAGTDQAKVAPTPSLADITPDEVAARCQAQLGEKLEVSTIAAMKTAMHGSWALCSGAGIFSHAQAGLQIDADERWAYLVWEADRLVAAPGLDNEGTMEYLDNSAMNGRPSIQVNFRNSYDWMFPAAPPTFSDVPRMMVLTTMVVEPITYVAVP